MEKIQFQAAIAKAKDISEKRNFTQTFDLIINLKDHDLKKPEHQVDVFVTLPHSRGKKVKVCALVGAELEQQAKEVCDSVILSDNFEKHNDKKLLRKIANNFDFFIAQANMMPKIATVFGRVFGPRGKMPNPKSGCIIPPNANLKPVYDKFQRTVRANAKTAPLIQVPIGTEDMPMEDVVENGMTIYNQISQVLPNEKHNIKGIYVKLTMGKPVLVGEKFETGKEAKQK